MSHVFLVQCKQFVLLEAGTFVQPNFETFFHDFFLRGAFFELPSERLVSLSFGVEEPNSSQGIFELVNRHELLRFFDDINTDVW